MASWLTAEEMLDSLDLSQVIQTVGLFGDILTLEETVEASEREVEGCAREEEGEGNYHLNGDVRKDEEQEKEAENNGTEKTEGEFEKEDRCQEKLKEREKEKLMREEAAHRDLKDEENTKEKEGKMWGRDERGEEGTTEEIETEEEKTNGASGEGWTAEGEKEVEKESQEEGKDDKTEVKSSKGLEEDRCNDDKDEVEKEKRGARKGREDVGSGKEAGGEKEVIELEEEQVRNGESEDGEINKEKEGKAINEETQEQLRGTKEGSKNQEKEVDAETKRKRHGELQAEGLRAEHEEQIQPFSQTLPPPSDPKPANRSHPGAENPAPTAPVGSVDAKGLRGDFTPTSASSHKGLESSPEAPQRESPDSSGPPAHLPGPSRTPPPGEDSELQTPGCTPQDSRRPMDANTHSQMEKREGEELSQTPGSSQNPGPEAEGNRDQGGQSPPQMDGDSNPDDDKQKESCQSKYKTVSYRKIRKGNTKQRVDEFEALMNS